MSVGKMHEIWIEQYDAAQGIKLRYGLKAAFDYLVAEKLLNFAEAAAEHPEFARELPRFVSQVRLMFTRLGHAFSVKTNASGAYRIKLAPGIYTVRASAGMSMRPRNINVHAPTTHLNFSIDTGIR